jgi:hypothetical protein
MASTGKRIGKDNRVNMKKASFIKRISSKINYYFFKMIYYTFLHHLLSDKLLIELMFRWRLGYWPNLESPKTFSEKLQWLKLHDRNPEYTQLVDKFTVREYIVKTIGEEYLIPLLGVWEKFEDIDFDKLPNQFVLKCTHNSGGNIICKDKNTLDKIAAKKRLNKLLKRNYFYWAREWSYKNVRPKIIAEKYMVDESEQELKDYKIFCFNGFPKIILVDYDRFINHKRNIFDLEWNYIPVTINDYPTDPNKIIERPDKLEVMLNLAKSLSKNYSHVRVDFYIITNKIYFGELTFFHGSGFAKFEPEEWDNILGSWITLPQYP